MVKVRRDRSGTTLGAEDVRHFVACELSRAKVPRDVEIVERIGRD